MAIKFKGLLAPTEVPTGDGRMFAAGKLTSRPMPIPLMVRFGSGGHDGATVVGRINRIFDGPGGYWGEGEFLDAAMVPEVPKAIYMLQQKVMGPSVDLDRDFTVEAVKHPLRPDKKAGLFKEYNVIGATLVPMPAFHQVHMSVETEPEDTRALLASAGIDMTMFETFAVNSDSWKSWPLAPRDYKFDADDAVKRIAYWAGVGSREPNLDRYASAFLWRRGDEMGDSLAQDSFRLPLADVINNELHLIYHAAYSAAALLSGAHGGLPNIPDEDKAAMVPVINEIYAACAAAFNDSNLISPFQEGQTQASINSDETEECGCNEMSTTINVTNGNFTFPADGTSTSTSNTTSVDFNMMRTGKVKEPYGDVKYADPGFRDSMKRYPIDTEEHIRAAWAYINVAKNAAEYTAEQLEKIRERIKAAAAKHGIEISDDEESGQMAVALADPERAALLAGAAPLAPPSAWFENPQLSGPTKLTITDDGRVFGHLAQWKVCHVGVGNACVMAPKTRANYSYFRQGSVVCDDGSEAPIGKITLGTGHANERWGVMPSREHYDNTGWAAAVVNVGEDRHGIWVNGALTLSMTPEKIAELRASALSGDWRMVNGNLELIAALAVNSPGFPIYREQNNRAFSLMAVGVIGADEETTEYGGEFSVEEQQENVEPEQYPQDDVTEDAAELAARMARLEEIDADLEDWNVSRREAQLAALDEEREQLAQPKAGRNSVDNEIFIQYNARFRELQEE
jgi:hypothetical protein